MQLEETFMKHVCNVKLKDSFFFSRYKKFNTDFFLGEKHLPEAVVNIFFKISICIKLEYLINFFLQKKNTP